MLSYIAMVRSIEEFTVPPNFGFHALSGDRAGSYAMTITRNWRLTFTLVDEQTVGELDPEDYN